MTNVDPFLQPMPEAFYSVFPAQDRDVIRARIEYEDRWRHDMWLRTGGGTDIIEGGTSISVNNDNSVSQLRGQVEGLKRDINALRAAQQAAIIPIDMSDFNPAVIDNIYTAVDRDFLVIETNRKIFLPLRPPKNAVIIAINGHTNSVNIDGNGKKINSSDSIVSQEQNTQMVFKYHYIKDRWYMSTTTIEDIEYKERIASILAEVADRLKTLQYQGAIISDAQKTSSEPGEFK